MHKIRVYELEDNESWIKIFMSNCYGLFFSLLILLLISLCYKNYNRFIQNKFS